MYGLKIAGTNQVSFGPVPVLMLVKIIWSTVYSVDPDEMQHYAAFHLGFHCMQKYKQCTP